MAANKQDLVNAVIKLNDEQGIELTKKQATQVVDNVLDSIIGLTGEAGKLQLIGFGGFEVRERAERNGRNPSTGESMVIPASKSPAFKAGKAFKDFVK